MPKITLDVSDTGKISDGFHTFDELYDHRCLLFIYLCLSYPHLSAWKQDYQDWFCLYFELPTGQVSYHCPNRFLYLVEKKIKQDPDYAWDGHNADMALQRIEAASHMKADGDI